MNKPKIYIRFEIPLKSKRYLGTIEIIVVEKVDKQYELDVSHERIIHGYRRVKRITVEEYNEIYVKEYDVEIVQPICWHLL